MGSLLRMDLAEQHLFKLTKSICICQGKKLLSLNQFPRKFHLKISRGSLSRLARMLLTLEKFGKTNSGKKTLCPKVSFYAAGRAKT